MSKEITFATALKQATIERMTEDPKVLVFGLGVPDPKGVFGTTDGLQELFGPERVFDTPLSENAMTGFAIGLALSGSRPILSHQRLDFALVSMEQLVNQASKWKYMFGDTMSCPIVVRMIIGRGWGQGPQHSQSLQSWFAHIPGLKVYMPATPVDAKNLMDLALRGSDPVIFLEHRWLHYQKGEIYNISSDADLEKPQVLRNGNDITLVSYSFSVVECLKASEWLSTNYNIECEIIDLRVLRPLNTQIIKESLKTTKNLLVVDQSVSTCGIGAEIITQIISSFEGLNDINVNRLGYPDQSVPTSPYQASNYYYGVNGIIEKVLNILNVEPAEMPIISGLGDQPDPSFEGPF